MVPQTLTSEQPITMQRPRTLSMTFFLLSLLGTSIACGGDIGDSDDVANLEPATSDSDDGRSNSGARGTPSTSPAVSTGAAATSGGANLDTDADERGIDSDDIDDLDRVGGSSGSSGGGRRGSVGRTSDDDDDDTVSDAGVLDGGDVDAGDVDAGDDGLNDDEEDEGEDEVEVPPDAGAADAGDAGAP